MNKLVVPYKDKNYTFSFASQWSELTNAQLQFIALHFTMWAKTYRAFVKSIADENYEETPALDLELQDQRINLLVNLCNLHWWPFNKRRRAFLSMLPDEVADVLLSVNFAFKEIGTFLCPLPSFNYNGNKYIGPGEDLNNISGAEFHFAEMYYSMAIDGDNEALNNFIAILYRLQGKGEKYKESKQFFKGDMRVEFNRFAVEYNARTLKKFSYKHKRLILLWYTSCRNQIIKNYPHIFKRAENSASSNGNDGWMPVFRALAKNPIDFEAIANQRLSYLLWELGQKHDDAKQLNK